MDREMEKALRERALGFDADEIVEEYAFQDGDAVLTKRKVTRKKVLPDMSAFKILLEEQPQIEHLSDAELEAHKMRLLNLLQEEESANGKSK